VRNAKMKKDATADVNAAESLSVINPNSDNERIPEIRKGDNDS